VQTQTHKVASVQTCYVYVMCYVSVHGIYASTFPALWCGFVPAANKCKCTCTLEYMHTYICICVGHGYMCRPWMEYIRTYICTCAHTHAHVQAMDGSSFSVRWRGFIRAANENVYTFTTQMDLLDSIGEGVRLWIDNQIVIDEWTAPTSRCVCYVCVWVWVCACMPHGCT
jgi:hypothetical protein